MRRFAIAAAAVGALMLTACSSNVEPTPAAETTAETTTTHVTPTTTTAPADTGVQMTDEQTDRVFLRVISTYGVDYNGDGATEIELAKSICGEFDRGRSERDVLPGLQKNGPNYSDDEAAVFIQTSVLAYCPQHG